MSKLKSATLDSAPTPARPIPPTSAPQKPALPTARTIECFTYALKAYSAERRKDGWWIARSPFSSGSERPEWSGPFKTIETTCLAIARRLATEIADRHTRSIEGNKLKPGDPLYGLKPTTRLVQRKSNGVDSAY